MEKKLELIYAEDVPKMDFRDIPWIAQFEAEKGVQNYYSVHWVMPKKREVGPGTVGHPPHMHRETEVLMFIGMDPDNHGDLGGEVEMCFGEKMEKRTFTKSCTVIIPGGTPHGFYRVVETHRPWLFVSVQEAAPRTEKILWDYLTQEQIEEIKQKGHFKDAGFD